MKLGESSSGVSDSAVPWYAKPLTTFVPSGIDSTSGSGGYDAVAERKAEEESTTTSSGGKIRHQHKKSHTDSPVPSSKEAVEMMKLAKEKKRKSALDPLNAINHKLDIQRKQIEKSLPSTVSSSAFAQSQLGSYSLGLNTNSASSMLKSSQVLRVGTNETPEGKLARLRQERLEREKIERARVEKLLGVKSTSVPSYDNLPIDDTKPHRRKGGNIRDEFGRTIGFADEKPPSNKK